MRENYVSNYVANTDLTPSQDDSTPVFLMLWSQQEEVTAHVSLVPFWLQAFCIYHFCM